jgi:hypothetical protein
MENLYKEGNKYLKYIDFYLCIIYYYIIKNNKELKIDIDNNFL